MSSDSSNSSKPEGPSYERVLAILAEAHDEVSTTHIQVTSARTNSSTHAMSSSKLTKALLDNIKDGQDDCQVRKESPQEILNSRIETEREILEFWDRSDETRQGMETLDAEEVENFPLQFAAFGAGMVIPPPRGSEVPGMVGEHDDAMYEGQTTLPHNNLYQWDANGTFQTQLPPPSRRAFDPELPLQVQEAGKWFQQSSVQPYELLRVPISAVAPPIDCTRTMRQMSPEAREELHQELEQSSPLRESSARASSGKDFPALYSPMSTGAVLGDDTDQYSVYGNRGHQNPAPVQQIQVTVQHQVALVPHKRQLATSGTATDSSTATQKKPKPGVVGKQLLSSPSMNVPFPPVVQGHPVNVTIVELLAFFPRYIHSSDVVERIASNGATYTGIMNIMNAHRNLAEPMQDNFILHAMQARMRKKGDMTATGGHDYTKWTIGKHQPLLNHNEDSLDISGLRTRFDIENFPMHRDAYSIAFKDLARGMKYFPSGFDALDLTRCVAYAAEHSDEAWVFPTDFRRMVQYLSQYLVGETFPVPITENHLDREAWSRWKIIR